MVRLLSLLCSRPRFRPRSVPPRRTMPKARRDRFSIELKKEILRRWRGLMIRWFNMIHMMMRMKAFNFQVPGLTASASTVPSASTSGTTTSSRKTQAMTSKDSTKDLKSVKELMAETKADKFEQKPHRCLHEKARKYDCSHGTFMECKQCGSRWRLMDACGEWISIPARPRPGAETKSAQPAVREHRAACADCREEDEGKPTAKQAEKTKTTKPPRKSRARASADELPVESASSSSHSRPSSEQPRPAVQQKFGKAQVYNLTTAPPLDELIADSDFMIAETESVALSNDSF